MAAILSFFESSLLLIMYSRVIKSLLRFRGIKVGKSFRTRALPLVIKDHNSIIEIGDNVFFKDRVDIRALKGAHLKIKSDVKLDKDVRIVATNGAKVTFSERSDIGCYSIFNCGADVIIGKDTLVAGFCYIQTGNHSIARHIPIRTQEMAQQPITIGDDCWLGGGSFIVAGAHLGAGVVVGANSLVNKSVGDFEVVAGSPAKVIKNRM